jgi:hypothetical protein
MFLKVVGYRGDVLPNWAKENSLEVPSSVAFQAGSAALIYHWSRDPEVLALEGQSGGFTKSVNNAVFNPNSLLSLLVAY